MFKKRIEKVNSCWGPNFHHLPALTMNMVSGSLCPFSISLCECAANIYMLRSISCVPHPLLDNVMALSLKQQMEGTRYSCFLHKHCTTPGGGPLISLAIAWLTRYTKQWIQQIISNQQLLAHIPWKTSPRNISSLSERYWSYISNVIDVSNEINALNLQEVQLLPDLSMENIFVSDSVLPISTEAF